MVTRKRFDDETKRAALQDVASGMTLKQVSEKYGTSLGSIQNWKKKLNGGRVNNSGSPLERLNDITRQLAVLENEKVSIQRRMRSERALPQIKKIMLELTDKQLAKLEMAIPELAEQARFLRDS